MKLKTHGFWFSAVGVALAVGLSAQVPAPAKPASPPQEQKPDAKPAQPTFRLQIDLVSQDVLVRDEKGQFVPDLKRDEFEVYEDGVKQDIASMTVVTGGRVTNLLAPPPPPPPEGIILPPSRRVNDVSGRIFVFFVDDLHLQFHNTPRVRSLFEKIAKELVHDGDMFGIVSSGPSSISIDMTYDKSRLAEAIKKMTGDELSPVDIINAPAGAGGPSEIRYRAHVAFSTVNSVLENLEKVHDRRKALVYVSDGYDFVPFQQSRLGLLEPNSPFAQNEMLRSANQALAGDDGTNSNTQSPTSRANDPQIQSEEFADADLARELSELTRAANRANATIYTIDPRGLVGAPDIADNLDPRQWGEYVRKSQDTLRTLAEDTGGYAIVNQNDMDKGLKRIDAETGDYYVLGFYSKNPDPLRRRRRIDIKVTRKNMTVVSRKEYALKPLPAPVSSNKK